MYRTVALLAAFTLNVLSYSALGAENLPKLVDLKKGTFADAQDPKKLLPSRLYLRFEPSRQGYFFDITALNGEFNEGPRYVKVGSTIPGSYAGDDNSVWYVFEGPKHNPDNWTSIPNPGKPGHYYLTAFDKKATHRTLPVVHSNPEDFEKRR